MKRIMKTTSTLLLALLLVFCAASCGNTVDTAALWEHATYCDDQVFGSGKITVQVEVKAGDRSVTLTVKTDQETLGAALLEHKLLEGEDGPYGLYVKKVNGITADFDIDQSYWALYKSGELCMAGVDTTTIADGEHYEVIYTK